MNPLYLHIEHLLQTAHCVVVPQFGTFVTTDKEACYVDAEQTFFPPLRIVRFNSNHTENDGLLVEQVMKTEHCSVSEAKYAIQSWVLELRQQLLTDSQVDFGNLGTFTQDEDGNLLFSTCQAGMSVPAYFGLDVLSIKQLNKKKKRTFDTHTSLSHTSKDIVTIRISRRAVHTALTVAACFILCFLFSSPLEESDTTFEQASIALKQTKNKPVIPEYSESLETTETPKGSEAPIQPEASITPAYAVIVASATTLRNATRYVEELHNFGFTAAHIYDNGQTLRVVISEFETETQAYNFTAKIRQESQNFEDAWVMKL